MKGIVEALRARYRGADHPVARSHFHIIWLLASGSRVSECAAASGYSIRWIEILARRYNAGGPDSLGDRRRANKGGEAAVDGRAVGVAGRGGGKPAAGLWTGPKVAAWIARETGRAHVYPQRGWAYLRRLDQSWQTPRPRHEQTATPEQQEAFKKNSRKPWIRRARQSRGPASRSGRSTSTGSA